MRVFVLGSGSSGNALLVESCGTRVLVDAGIGPKVLASRLAELGVELHAGALDGIVTTHHHGDHFGHADKIATTFAAPLYLHHGIASPAGGRRGRRADLDLVDVAPESKIQNSELLDGSTLASAVTTDGGPPIDVRRYDIGRALRIGELTITTVQVPHDAAQVAIRVDDGDSALGVATDVGRVTPGLVALLAECDAAVVEANHCSEMLAFSEYPEVVKRRVSGGFGHLSNDQTAELAARLVGSRMARLWLGHLSRSNNTPARAHEAVASRARRIDVDVLSETAPVALDVRSVKPYQLGLPF